MIAYIIQPLCHISGTEDVIRDLRGQFPKIKEFRYYKGGAYSNQDLKEADIVFIRPYKNNNFNIPLDRLTRGVRKELASVIGIKTVKGVYKRSSNGKFGAYNLNLTGSNTKLVQFATGDVTLSTTSVTKILDILAEEMSWDDKAEAHNIRTSLSIVHTKVEINPWDKPKEKPGTRDATLEDRVNILTDTCTVLRKELIECRQKYQEDIEKIKDELKNLEEDMLKRYKANKQRCFSLAAGGSLEQQATFDKAVEMFEKFKGSVGYDRFSEARKLIKYIYGQVDILVESSLMKGMHLYKDLDVFLEYAKEEYSLEVPWKIATKRTILTGSGDVLSGYKLPSETIEDMVNRVSKTAWQTYNPLNNVYDCAPLTKEYWEAFAEPKQELLLIKKNK